ncbi:hypothetical protein [uncultured Alistipes sp.]|uniref:hypothetical protein n=1 Tax=uncultured Alistipes sp. TaxID=538949 RepID=UPI00262F93E3|nr:hypothetical protein [uncultured Alistipes sp.]
MKKLVFVTLLLTALCGAWVLSGGIPTVLSEPTFDEFDEKVNIGAGEDNPGRPTLDAPVPIPTGALFGWLYEKPHTVSFRFSRAVGVVKVSVLNDFNQVMISKDFDTNSSLEGSLDVSRLGTVRYKINFVVEENGKTTLYYGTFRNI